MGLVIRKKFDWEEDLEEFDWDRIINNSGISGKHRYESRLSLKGWIRKILGIQKGE